MIRSSPSGSGRSRRPALAGRQLSYPREPALGSPRSRRRGPSLFEPVLRTEASPMSHFCQPLDRPVRHDSAAVGYATQPFRRVTACFPRGPRGRAVFFLSLIWVGIVGGGMWPPQGRADVVTEWVATLGTPGTDGQDGVPGQDGTDGGDGGDSVLNISNHDGSVTGADTLGGMGGSGGNGGDAVAGGASAGNGGSGGRGGDADSRITVILEQAPVDPDRYAVDAFAQGGLGGERGASRRSFGWSHGRSRTGRGRGLRVGSRHRRIHGGPCFRPGIGAVRSGGARGERRRRQWCGGTGRRRERLR